MSGSDAPAASATTCVGDGYARAVFGGGLHVTLLFGRPTGDSARELVAVLDREPFDTPRLSYFDASGLEAIGTEAFSVITEHMNRRRDDLTRVVTRQAIVTPPGMPGTIVTGYRAVFDFAYPVEFFTARGPALEFLGRGDAGDSIERLAALASSHPLAVRLRQLLAGSASTSLADAAKQLGVSERSLQRHLQSAGTSFLLEIQAARIAVAKRMLVETDRKLIAIALEVGCSTVQSFSAMFRRVTGETPGGFRARHRR